MPENPRYWDGTKWAEPLEPNDHVGPPRASWSVRLARLLGALFAVIALSFAFAPSHALNKNCGTWMSPRYSGINGTINQPIGGIEALEYPMLQAQCQDALDNRRFLTLICLVVGGVVVFGLPRVVDKN